MTTLFNRVFGILFVAGETGVTVQQLSESLNEDVEAIEKVIDQIKHVVSQQFNLPLMVININGYYRFMTTPQIEADVEKFAQIPLMQPLSRAAIETLAIIAYRQPITRLEVDQIRGVSSAAMIQKLLLRDLVAEVGRLDAPGKPIIYGVTSYFLDYFGISTLEELPQIEPLLLGQEQIEQSLFNTKEWDIDYFENGEKE